MQTMPRGPCHYMSPVLPVLTNYRLFKHKLSSLHDFSCFIPRASDLTLPPSECVLAEDRQQLDDFIISFVLLSLRGKIHPNPLAPIHYLCMTRRLNNLRQNGMEKHLEGNQFDICSTHNFSAQVFYNAIQQSAKTAPICCGWSLQIVLIGNTTVAVIQPFYLQKSCSFHSVRFLEHL